MRKINALFFIFALFATPAAYAWDASALRDAWGAPSLDTCGKMDLGNAAVGGARDICAVPDSEELGNGRDLCRVGDSFYVRGFTMLIARELNENGAYFCPTVIGTSKKRWELSRTGWNQPYWTVYYEVPGSGSGVNGCFWVCKDGYHGDRCQSTETDTCNTAKITRDNWGVAYSGTSSDADDEDGFAIKKATRGVESEVAMFYEGVKDACGNKCRGVRCSPYEHDMVLAVVDWLPGQHGVKVQPFVIRGGFDPEKNTEWGSKGGVDSTGGNCWGWNCGPGRGVAYAVGSTQTILCRTGYEPNFTNTDCVAVDPDVCDVLEAINDGTTCSTSDGYHDFGEYDPETMEMHFFDDCWGYLCKTTGYGFDPGASRATCVDCGVSDMRNGIDKYGNCVRCDVGKIFNSTTGTCVTATALSRDRLYYGPGKDENTAVIKQCWVEPDKYSYSECVWGLMPTATFRGLVQSQYIERIGGVSIGGGGSDGGSGGGSGGGSDGGNNDEPWVAGGYHYEGPVGGGSGGGSGIKTMETGLVSNPQMY